ncbi:MAG: hypothetical protein ACI9PY_003321 [Ascidiaceihabitans sp.]|jgi:hypothetical protein
MTKFTTLTLLAITIPAFAMAQASADTNGDGVLTLDEVQAVYPDVTADSFAGMDLNADGALDGDEVAAAQEAGLMPAE